MHVRNRSLLTLAVLAVVPFVSAAAPPMPGGGTPLAVEPLTWDVVGLDSNRPLTDGPDTFPVGARVCNPSGSAVADVATELVLDPSADAAFALAAGDPAVVDLGDLDAGACADAYHLVTIDRAAARFPTGKVSGSVAPYRVHATAPDGSSGATPDGRQLYTEKLVSQSRNEVTGISGPEIVYEGERRTYELEASTAPRGYEQLATFLTLSPSVFRVLDVDATYSAPVGGTNDRVYADACGWDPDPASGTYLTCVGPANHAGAKAGGSTIRVTYEVEVVGPGSNDVTGVIYDFSGSSFHYNAGFGGRVLAVEARPTLDLGVVADDAAPVPAGASTPVDVTITNHAGSVTDGMADVVVELPDGLTYGSDTGSCAVDGQTLTCLVGALGSGDSATFQVEVTSADAVEHEVAATVVPRSDDQGPLYRDADLDNDHDTATVRFMALPPIPNVPPIALDDAWTVEHGLVLVHDHGANDADPDGTITEWVLVDGPSHGSVSSWSATGEIQYVPDAGFGGRDTVTYRAVDDDGASSDLATITFTVVAPVVEEPTTVPTEDPTADPTDEPTVIETDPEPTSEPTTDPTTDPTVEPAPEPSPEPSTDPTPEPTTSGPISVSISRPVPPLPAPVPPVEPAPQVDPAPEVAPAVGATGADDLAATGADADALLVLAVLLMASGLPMARARRR